LFKREVFRPGAKQNTGQGMMHMQARLQAIGGIVIRRI